MSVRKKAVFCAIDEITKRTRTLILSYLGSLVAVDEDIARGDVPVNALLRRQVRLQGEKQAFTKTRVEAKHFLKIDKKTIKKWREPQMEVL